MDYKNIIQTTITEVYPNYFIKLLLKTLEEKGVISYKVDLLSENSYVFSNEDETPYHPRYDSLELLTALEIKVQM